MSCSRTACIICTTADAAGVSIVHTLFDNGVCALCRAHCSVGAMRQRGEWSRLAVGQCVTTSLAPTTVSANHSVSVQQQLSPTLSSSHGSSLTRGTCHRSPCIMPTASSLFHETPDWDSSESTCPRLRCIIQPCYRHHPDNQTS